MTSTRTGIVLITFALTIAFAASAQTLYKSRGDNGEWIYSDRPPVDGEVDETRNLESGVVKGTLDVSHTVSGRNVQLVANNGFYAPVELTVKFNRIEGMRYPHPDQKLRWILPPRSETILLNLAVLDSVAAPNARYSYRYSLGDPDAVHQPVSPYRVPFSVATDYPVTQAYPDADTHDTPDSQHAVDVAMPVGTNIFAARMGVVFDVTTTNFCGGLDRDRDAPAANVVRILHDDGTYAVYAHLNWNSIRVRPGDQVERGEYIADSGNTGFSSGPHLHFAVIRNSGMTPVSVPVRFEGANASAVVAARGNVLTAY